MSSEGGDLLDLQPRIRERKASACEHMHIEVSLVEAELECVDCGANLDPWWYLRKLATDDAAQRAYDAEFRQIVQTHERTAKEALAKINADIVTVAAELNRLREIKSELCNELMPDGRPLGAHAPRRRRPNG